MSCNTSKFARRFAYRCFQPELFCGGMMTVCGAEVEGEVAKDEPMRVTA